MTRIVGRRVLLLAAASAGTSAAVVTGTPSVGSLRHLSALSRLGADRPRPGPADPGPTPTRPTPPAPGQASPATTGPGGEIGPGAAVPTSRPTSAWPVPPTPTATVLMAKPAPTAGTSRRTPSTAALAAYDRGRPGETAVAAVNLATGRALAYRSASTFITASVVKVDILVTLLLAAQARGRSLTAAEADTCRDMITRSDNDAASSLWTAVGGASGVARTHRRLGMTDTVPGADGHWGNTRTTARDRLRLLRALTDRTSPLTASRRRLALDLMGDVVADQRWGVSVAGTGGPVALKNGWLGTTTDGGLWTVNSTGHVVLRGGDPAVIAVLTRRSPDLGTGVDTVEQLARLAAVEIAR